VEGQAPPAEGGQDQLGELLANLHQGLGMLLEAAQAVSPQVAEKVQALVAGLEDVTDSIAGGAPPAQGQIASPMAGPAGTPESMAA
jgi:hypothetical protein